MPSEDPTLRQALPGSECVYQQHHPTLPNNPQPQRPPLPIIAHTPSPACTTHTCFSGEVVAEGGGESVLTSP